jgi:prepilin peptidase CpaA
MSNGVAFIALAVGLTACVTDLLSRRIPNVLTLGAAAAALFFHVSGEGMLGLQAAATGWVVGMVLFLPLFLLGGMGAGDVKLLAALGAWLGPWDAIWLAIYASVAGGVMAIAVAITHGYLHTALRNVRTLLGYWWVVGPRSMPAMTLESSRAPRLAYAIPVFVGTVVTIWQR